MAQKLRVPELSAVIDSYIQEQKPKTALEVGNLLRDLFADTVEKMLKAELDAKLGYMPNERAPKDTTNRRNGTTKKKVRTHEGEMGLSIPRDREGHFEPIIVPKHSRDISGIEEKVIRLYGRGMSNRDISKTMQEIYGFQLSPETISDITEAVFPMIKEWRERPLKSVYPFIFIDALYVDVKEDRRSTKKSIYTIVGIDADGKKDVIGFWLRESEGAKEWLNIFDELKQRGVERVCFVSADGLTGIEEAIKTAFGRSVVFQRCIVHMIRNGLKYIPNKYYRKFCEELKAIYGAASIEVAEENFKIFKQDWSENYPGAVKVWNDNFYHVKQLFDYPSDIRKQIYTTNTIESLNAALRKVTVRKGALPSEAALSKLLYLRIMDLTERWSRSIKGWAIIRGELDIVFPDWEKGGKD
jgi:transposase-like protein